MDDVCALSLLALADGIRQKRFSAVEATRACLERAERLQSAWNAFIHLEPDAALDQARAADRAQARGDDLGPLHGVPVAHKDNYYRKGRRTTCASLIRRDFVPDHTATTAARMEAAGAIDLGGVNCSDSGCNPFGLNRLVGRARNPWDPERITGGSSSGSAAAVAGRLVFASLGGDAGGSIRLPASMCGVVGLKPTEGRISRHGIMPLSATLDTSGPLTRTVADCAAVTAVIAGADPLDPTTRACPVPDYAAGLENSLKGMRIGVATNYFGDALAADVGAAVAGSLAVFVDAGARIVPIPVPDPTPMDVLANVIIFAEGARVHKRWLQTRADDYTPVTRHAMEFGLCCPATRYIEALTYRGRALAAFMETVFQDVDVLHTPVLSHPVPTMADVDAYLEERGRLPFDLSRNTKPANYLGLPALSVPCGTTGDGMPTAFQLMGRPFDEALLFNLGHIFQKSTGYHERSPAPLMAARATTSRNTGHPESNQRVGR